jgi:hypothetical protein
MELETQRLLNNVLGDRLEGALDADTDNEAYASSGSDFDEQPQVSAAVVERIWNAGDGIQLPSTPLVPTSLVNRTNKTQPYSSKAVRLRQVKLFCQKSYSLADVYQLSAANAETATSLHNFIGSLYLKHCTHSQYMYGGGGHRKPRKKRRYWSRTRLCPILSRMQ